MAAQIYYLTTGAAASSNHLAFATSAPGTATTGTGWTVGTTAPTVYSAMAAGVERAASTFGSTALPDGTGPNNTLGDCYRSSGLLDGRWANTAWTLTVPLIAVTAGGTADVALTFRLWRGVSATGSDAVEITSGIQTTNTLADLAVGVAQNATLAFSPGGVGVVGEYLFLQLALKIVQAGGTANDDTLIRVGSASNLTTANWVPADLTLYDVVLAGQGYRIQWDGYSRGRAQTQPPTINTDATIVANTLNGVTFSQTVWQGGTGSSATSSGNNTLSSAPGIDPIGTTGSLKVGPAVLLSHSSSSPSIRAFGLRAGNIFAGGADGQLYERTASGSASDTWTTRASVAGGAITAMAGGTYTVNTATNQDMLVLVSNSSGKVYRWNGAANATIGNVSNTSSKRPLIGIWCISTGGEYVPTGQNDSPVGGIENSTACPAIIGKTTASGLVCAGLNGGMRVTSNTGGVYATMPWYTSGLSFTQTFPPTAGQVGTSVKADWFGTYGQPPNSNMPASWRPTVITSYTDPIGIKVLVSSTAVLYFVANKSAPNGAVYYETWSPGTSQDFIKGLVSSGPSLTDAYPVGAATLGTTAYLLDSLGRLYTIGALSASFALTQIASNIALGYTPIDFRSYNGALWAGFQVDTKIMYRRYGPASTSGANVGSEPIYGASVSATTSGLFYGAQQVGADLFLGVGNGANTPIYRVDYGRYTTDAVSAVSVAYTAGLDGTDKKFKSVKLTYAALASGDSIAVAFQVDNSGSWIPAGSVSTVGAVSSTFAFAGATTGNAIQIKVTLTSGTSSTTPQVTNWTFSTTVQQDFLREWKIGLRMEQASGYPLGLRDGSADPQTGVAVSAINWTMFEAQDTIRLRDIDGTIYSVEIWDYSEKLASLPQVFGYQIVGELTLREVA